MRIAQRIERLGTETAFAAAAEANAYAAEGHKVYPFHLGDMNLPTPENIVEAALRAIRDGKTGYCPNAGIPQLREALAEELSLSRGVRYTMENVAIQPGGKPVIGKFFLTLMNPGDEVLYPNPGYPIYESLIEFYGGKAVPYGYHEGRENFGLNMGELAGKISPKTRLLVLNDPQNPMGAECSKEEIEGLAELVLRHDLYVLCDEAYFDIRYEGKGHSLVALPGMAERCVILYTFSKKFAMTGWRLGAAVGPKGVVDVIAKLNVNDESCSNHFVQYAALEALTGDPSGAKGILDILQQRRDVTVDLLNGMRGVRCFRPRATFYLFPDVTEAARRKGLLDYGAFRSRLLRETGVSVCTRQHFGRPLPGESRFYIRLAYSGIDTPEIEEGLGRFKSFVEG
jgi:aspartate/methionine/tyrosine aminotransferase